MTTLTDTQVVTASGGLVELGYLEKTSTVAVNVGSGSQVSVVGPLTVVSDGSPLMVEFFCEEASAPATAGAYLIAALWVDGVENTRTLGVAYGGATGSNHGETLHAVRRVTLAAGSHTIEIKGWSSAAANFYAAAGGTAAYAPMFLRVSKIVEATQWPAVTTGTITCTSATRPSSPIIGQQILETDTGQQYYWDGAIWRGTTVLNYNAQTGTTYTFVMADASTQMVTLSNASAITATIPTNATTPFPTGTVLNFMQTGAGQVTVQGAGGVTVNTYSSKTKTAGQWASGSAMKTATDTWVLFGNLA
jgi:hypothetical protein